jgi:hypothetical protein
MVGKRQSVPSFMRRLVFRRDDYKCVKCGKTKGIQVHHIIPVYMGGKDAEGNGVTLCEGCHAYAPDNPIQFFKWAAHHLPPDMERAMSLSKIFISLLFYKYKMSDKTEEANNLIDDLGMSMWKIYVSNDINGMADLFRKLEKETEEDDEDAKTTTEQRPILPDNPQADGGKKEVA